MSSHTTQSTQTQTTMYQNFIPMVSNPFELFQSDKWQVQTLTLDGEPWFVAKDVCTALGLSDTNKALLTLDNDEKCEHEDYSGSGRKPWLINESGLYRLIFRSRKTKAEHFRKWIASNVLPSIRKTGEYRLQSRNKALEEMLEIQNKTIEIQQESIAMQQEGWDEAIRTRGQISRNREAVAMNKASQLSKQNMRLKNRLGEGNKWMKVEFIPWVSEFFPNVDIKAIRRIVGKRLTAWCKEHNYSVKKITDERHGQVNAYSVAAINDYHQFLVNSHVEKAKYAWLLRSRN